MTIVTNIYRVAIDARPELVFPYVSDLTRHPEWSGAHLKIEAVSPGPVTVGSQYLSHGDVAGQKDRPNQLQVTQFESPTTFAFIAVDPDFGEVSHEFTFGPQSGGTLMQRTVTLSMSPIKAFMFRALILPLVARPLMDKALTALKKKMERGVT